MKVIALYLPQYHQIKENDRWWGNGYTEWTSVRRGKKIIEGQYQPREPLNDNYYNLLDIDVMKWQVELAKQYHVYGFCFYHYWFNGKCLLEKPLEQFLAHTEIDFHYYLCWANERWTTIWEGDRNPRVLIEQNYSNKKDVEKHIEYLLQFFYDKRYMKKGNKPILSIYNPIAMSANNLEYLITTWNKKAIEAGFDGIEFTYLCADSMCYMGDEHRRYFEYGVEYEPSYVQHLEDDVKRERRIIKRSYFMQKIKNLFPFLIQIVNSKKLINSNSDINGVKIIRDYDSDWEKILNIQHEDYTKYVPGGFVDWDNTPRHGNRGKVILGATPEKFEKYFSRLVDRAVNLYKSDSIVLFAWNEWSEGGYLEPDKKWGTGYLQAIKRVLEEKDLVE